MDKALSSRGTAILSVAEMYRADRAAMAAGVSGLRLMESAGAAVVDTLCARWAPRSVAVLCGPGNNGGDGFVVARRLMERGWPVRLALLGKRDGLKGDAAAMAAKWTGPVEPLEPKSLAGVRLVVDAIFGAGLTRPVDGAPAAVLQEVADRGLPCVAIDMPSGVDGETGAVLGIAAPAALTVTFFRPKPGHCLMPGRALCGDLRVAPIGIPRSVLDTIAPTGAVNGTGLWLSAFPWPRADGHKYSRGHAVVVGGKADASGAARLAAVAALRAGAGLVTVAVPSDAVPVYGSQLTAVMMSAVDSVDDFAAFLSDSRRNAVLLGPGGGVGAETRARALAALGAGKACVLDADAITSFADRPQELLNACSERTVLTPHEGEFRRLFPDAGDGDKLSRARAAARDSGAVVLLKGYD
ncbi:MAG: NAD(P)H-hydrate epimerase, partial [Rhodospirillaceae bacterium]|nr:NAD(P)H-hydrate epimerase [Rhodospirillaceae bacterium]